MRRIFRNLAEENPTAARRVAREALLAGDSLALFPSRGCSGSVVGTRELVAVRHYVLVHRINEDIVTILRVWHAAQDRP